MEGASVAQARIVDEEIDGDVFGEEPIGESLAAVRGCEIGRIHADVEMRMNTTEVTREFLKEFVPARHQNESAGIRGELAREFGAQPG
jgi:hypothetical protein